MVGRNWGCMVTEHGERPRGSGKCLTVTHHVVPPRLTKAPRWDVLIGGHFGLVFREPRWASDSWGAHWPEDNLFSTNDCAYHVLLLLPPAALQGRECPPCMSLLIHTAIGSFFANALSSLHSSCSVLAHLLLSVN